MTRFVYSHHRTKQQAEAALEDYFASGQVCEGERPTIVRKRYAQSGEWFNIEING